MKRVARFMMLGLLCLPLAACGGKPELGPATETPKVDQAKLQEEMKKSFELGKPQGTMPGAAPKNP